MTKTKEKLREIDTARGTIRVHATKQTNTSAFTPVEGWRVLRAYQAKAEMPSGEKQQLVYEEWVHPSSKSGIVFTSQFDEKDTINPTTHNKHKAGEVYYTITGYGIGTIDPHTFSELSDIAPIQYSEANNLEDARKALAELMKENADLAKAY